jgi:hypothetical protein
MHATFDAEMLGLLRTTEEVGIRTSRHPNRATIIWIVVVDDVVFVRSFRGPKGQWHVAATADGQATLDIGDRQIAVRVTAVTNPDSIAAVSRAFLAKYAASPYAKEMVRAEILSTTLRLDPM